MLEKTQERHPMENEPAPQVSVLRAENGSDFALAELWRNSPAILVFLRHTGCTFCREYVMQLRDARDQFAPYRVTIGLITVGKPEDVAQFCESRHLPESFLCLSDPDKAAYRAFGLSRGTASELLSAHVMARGLQSVLHGHLAGLPKGDPFQMPGTFIVDQSGIVRYAHRHKDASDNPPNAELFAVLEKLIPVRA